MNIVWNLIKIGLMVTLIASCDERKSTDYEEHLPLDKTDFRLDDLIFCRLPLGSVAPRSEVFSEGMISPSVAESELSDTANMVFNDLTQLNQFGGQYAYGHFILTNTNAVVGYSFLPAGDGSLGDTRARDGSKMIDQPRIMDIFWIYNRWVDVVRDSGSIGDLGRLTSIDSIEFVDFGFVGFAKGIWSDLSSMSEAGSLRGLGVFRGDDFLAVRDEHALPKVLGLTLRLDDINKLDEIGIAFSNLRFLTLSVRDSQEINEIFRRDYLRKYFPNLRGFMMANTYLDPSKYSMDPHRPRSLPLMLNPDRVPKEIRWICIDGTLLSKDDMLRYNTFGRRLRYGRGAPVFKEGPINDVSVVYLGFGYSATGARSIRPWEYSELENLWRNSR